MGEGESGEPEIRRVTRRLRELMAEVSDADRRRVYAELADGGFSDALPAFGAGDPHLLSDVLQNIPGSVFQYLLLPDGRHEIPFLSSGVEPLSGYTSREVTQHPEKAFERVHPDDLERVRASIRRSAETLKTWRCAYRINHPDGSIRWALGIGTPRRLGSGAVLWNTVNVDITLQKEAERAAEEREALIRSMFDAAFVGLATLDPRSRVVDANQAVARMLGAPSAAACVGASILELVDAAHRGTLASRLDEVRQGTRVAFALTSESRALSVTLVPVATDRAGGDLVLFEGLDVTAERQRDELERLMAWVAETASVGGFVIRPDESLLLHASSRSILDADVPVGTIEQLAQAFGPDDAGDVATGLRAVVAGQRHHWTRDVGPRHDRWFRLYAAVRLDARGHRRVVGAIQDITPQRKEQDEVQHAQRLEALGGLAGGVAHDFNNVLTAILGSADLMVGNASSEDAPLLEEIMLAATLGQAMTQRLLTLARKQPAHPRAVDLARHLAEAMLLWRRMVGERVRLELRVAAEHHWIRFDPALLDQVIMNLLLNARDALPRGGRVTLELEGREVGPVAVDSPPGSTGWHRLVVRDEGRGMTRTIVERALEPFYTTKGVDGTGLGLSTSHAIVRQAGGHLELESEAGVGTAVIVWLPRNEPEAGPEPPPPREGTPSSGYDVLLVEDDARVRRVVGRMLERLGHRVHAAQGLGEALSAVGAGPIHLVVSDVVMPGHSGPELVAALRARAPELRALFVSGYPDAELDRLGLHLSDPLLPKPFSMSELAKQIDLVMGD